MNYYVYRRLLILELLVIPAVAIIFKTVENRLLAGAIAGTVFVLVGAYIVIMGVRVKSARRSASFPIAVAHLFLIALPLMITRLLNSGLAFSEVEVWGMPGPFFHRLSTFVYLALVAATIIDLVRSRREERGAMKVQ